MVILSPAPGDTTQSSSDEQLWRFCCAEASFLTRNTPPGTSQTFWTEDLLEDLVLGAFQNTMPARTDPSAGAAARRKTHASF